MKVKKTKKKNHQPASEAAHVLEQSVALMTNRVGGVPGDPLLVIEFQPHKLKPSAKRLA